MKLESIKTYEEFKSIVKGDDEIVLACFTAEWCDPCKLMKEELDVLHDELQGVARMITIDIDESKEIVLKEDVQGVPTIICYKKGKEKDRVGGYKKAASVRKLLKL